MKWLLKYEICQNLKIFNRYLNIYVKLKKKNVLIKFAIHKLILTNHGAAKTKFYFLIEYI